MYGHQSVFDSPRNVAPSEMPLSKILDAENSQEVLFEERMLREAGTINTQLTTR